MSRHPIEVQGHRGARGLLPENTLPGFETALDVGVDSIETDIHLTRDDIPTLFHDATLNGALVRSLTLEQLRTHRVGNALATPLAVQYAAAHRFHPYAIPTLAVLFDFVAYYAAAAGKTEAQRECARNLIFDLELKRVPFEPGKIGDGFTGDGPGLLECQVVAAIHQAGQLKHTRVRSFDHRSVRAIKNLEPTLETGLLIQEAAPCNIASMLKSAGASIYCPEYHFVDEEIVRQVHAANCRIIPFTVNEEAAWGRLIAWGVDGITTDYPDRLVGLQICARRLARE